jgi:hypothetical protein
VGVGVTCSRKKNLPGAGDAITHTWKLLFVAARAARSRYLLLEIAIFVIILFQACVNNTSILFTV